MQDSVAALAMEGYSSNVPAFLTKLWTLVEDPETNHLICWNTNGSSFHVFDQSRFAKDVLPKYFKHNNMASFVRQLNMYGFRKVVNIEQGGLVKPDRDDTEFQHLYFLQGHEHLLELIKRKVSVVKSEETKMHQEDLSRLSFEIQVLRSQQEGMECQLQDVKQHNEALWKEVLGLRQNHLQQQQVIGKLIQFLFGQLQPNPGSPVPKRKRPLMLDDRNSAPQVTKFRRPLTLDPLHDSCLIQASHPSAESASCFNSPSIRGLSISEVSDATQSNDAFVHLLPSTERDPGLLLIKEETSGPYGKPPLASPAVPLLALSSCPGSPLLPVTVVQSGLDGRRRCDELQPEPLQPQERRPLLDRETVPDLLDGADLNLEGFQIFLRNQPCGPEDATALGAFNPMIPSSEQSLNDTEADLPSVRDGAADGR